MKRKKGLLCLFCLTIMLLLSSCTEAIDETYNDIMNRLGEIESSMSLSSETDTDTLIERNEKGLELIDEGRAEEALELFLATLETIDKDESTYRSSGTEKNIKDTTLNNISYAYNELGYYEESLAYIEQALVMLPNSDAEYINQGNAFFNLDRYEEAITSYNEALKKDSSSKFAYYGRGQIKFYQFDYESALEDFNKYTKLDPTDSDGMVYKAYCLLYNGERKNALEYIEEQIDNNEDIYDLYYAKAVILEESETYETLDAYYRQVSEKFYNNLEAQIDRGIFYYNYGKYNKSIEYFETIIDTFTEDEISIVYEWLIYDYIELGEYDEAIEYGQKGITIYDQSHELYNALGNAYLEKTLYMESVEYFEKAIALNPYYENAYINKLYALYTGKRYSKCIEYSKEALEIFNNSYDIRLYLAESYFESNMYEEALKEYEKALEVSPDDDYILSYMAYTYLLLEDMENCEEYINKTLSIDSENYIALYVKEELESRKEKIGTQITQFYTENYLYDENLDAMINRLNTLLPGEQHTNKEISDAIDKVKEPNDPFTFVAYGEIYDYFMSLEEQDVELKKHTEDSYYLKINTFGMNTGNRVIEILDNIEDSQNKTLIIDLRGNTGGDTSSANNILDALLPECVTCTLIYRDGYTYNYYSDASFIPFKDIYIFVDENSASASELITLGLKTYLNNVTIVGKNTYGKGVGQTVFHDKKRKLMVLVVNHYWNVRQENILETGIKPDIYINSSDINQYFEAIGK